MKLFLRAIHYRFRLWYIRRELARMSPEVRRKWVEMATRERAHG